MHAFYKGWYNTCKAAVSAIPLPWPYCGCVTWHSLSPCVQHNSAQICTLGPFHCLKLLHHRSVAHWQLLTNALYMLTQVPHTLITSSSNIRAVYCNVTMLTQHHAHVTGSSKVSRATPGVAEASEATCNCHQTDTIGVDLFVVDSFADIRVYSNS